MNAYVVVNGFPEEGWGLYGVYSNRDAAEAHAKAMAARELQHRKEHAALWTDPEDLKLTRVEKGWALGTVDYYLVFEFPMQDSHVEEDA